MNKRLIIIDGNSIINRAFYALPQTMDNKEGLHTNAIYGFTTMLFKMIDIYKPTHISVAFDRKAPTFRHKEYSDNKEGLHTNAIYGFTTMLFKMIDIYKPTHISVAFDRKAPTFRHKEYSDYKAGRKKMPQELFEQMQPLKELLDAFKIERFEIDGYEADDIIGTISKAAEASRVV